MAQRLSATMSSTYQEKVNSKYRGDVCIDGDRTSICATEYSRGNWLSVEVPRDTPVGYVAVWNRRDNPRFNAFLGQFEVWMGSQAGELKTLCGRSQYSAAANNEPYVLWCGGATGGWVTMKQTGSISYISVAELEAYVAPWL